MTKDLNIQPKQKVLSAFDFVDGLGASTVVCFFLTIQAPWILMFLEKH